MIHSQIESAMNNRRRSRVYEFFDRIPQGFRCGLNIDGNIACGTVISQARKGSTVAFNLKRHLSRKHAAELEGIEDEPHSSASTSRAVLTTPTTSSTTPRTSKPKPTKSSISKNRKSLVETDSETVKRGIVSMCVSGTPLTVFASPGFASATGGLPYALGVGLDSAAVRRYVEDFAKKTEMELRRRLKDKMVYLMIDGASSGRRLFVSISCRFLEDGAVVVKTLGVSCVSGVASRSRVGDVADMIQNALVKFDVRKERIVGMSVDDSIDLVTHGNETALEIESNRGLSEDEAERIAVVHDFELISLGARSLRFAIEDALRKPNCYNLLKKIRDFITRTRIVLTVMRETSIHSPILDNEMNWTTTFSMLERLLESKPYLHNLAEFNPELYFSAADWTSAERLHSILETPMSATVKLRRESPSPGDFFRLWNDVKDSIASLVEDEEDRQSLAEEILSSLEWRERRWLLCPAVLGGMLGEGKMFEDSRRAEAKEMLLDLATRVTSLKDLDSEREEHLFKVEPLEDMLCDQKANAADEDSLKNLVKKEPDEGDFIFAASNCRKREVNIVENGRSLLKDFGKVSCLHQKRVELTSSMSVLIDKLTEGVRNDFDPEKQLQGKTVVSEALREAMKIATLVPTSHVSGKKLFQGLEYLTFSMKDDFLNVFLFLRMNA